MKTVSYDEKFKGTVTFFDPLTITQGAAWEYAIADFQKSRDKGGGVDAMNLAFIPGIIACVSEWKLEGFPERVTIDSFSEQSRKDRSSLISFLVTEISKIYSEEEDPNE